MYIKFEDWDGLALGFFLHEFCVDSKRGSRDVLSMAEPWPPQDTALKMQALLGRGLGYFLF